MGGGWKEFPESAKKCMFCKPTVTSEKTASCLEGRMDVTKIKVDMLLFSLEIQSASGNWQRFLFCTLVCFFFLPFFFDRIISKFKGYCNWKEKANIQRKTFLFAVVLRSCLTKLHQERKFVTHNFHTILKLLWVLNQ